MTNINLPCIVMAYEVMAYIVMSYIVMAYTVMAYVDEMRVALADPLRADDLQDPISNPLREHRALPTSSQAHAK